MSDECKDVSGGREEEFQSGKENIEESQALFDETAGGSPADQAQASVEEAAVSEAQSAIQAAEQKAEENYDKFLRVYAEFENYKKRMEKEKSEFIKYANEGMIKDILVVVDNLERAIEQTKNHDQSEGVALGVEMILKQLKDILDKYGVKEMRAMGEPFDPRLHEAVIHEVADEYEENMVISELQKGYILKDRLIRPAMVKVSKKSRDKAETVMNDEE